MRATCPHCQTPHDWPDNAQALQCPRCRRTFAPPPILDVVEAEEPPEVLPVNPPPIELSPAAEGFFNVARGPLTANQRCVYALLGHTFSEYHGGCIMVGLGLLIVPFMLVIGAALSFGVMTVSYFVLSLLGDGANGVLYGAVVFVALFAKVLDSMYREAPVRIMRNDGKADRFEIGRLSEVFHAASPAWLGLIFGMCFGFQCGLLYYTNNHGGLDIAGGFWQCFLVTLDNACHGIFLDIFELFNIHFGDKLEFGTLAAVGMQYFRAAYDLLALIFAWELYQRWSMRRLLAGYPSYKQGVPALARWVFATVGNREGWPRRYFDEFMFLLIAAEYLTGDYRQVSRHNEVFPHLRINDNVRALFVNEANQPLLGGDKSLD